ncbi:MAG: 5-(carboxyamino)imidazole ribonucleotide synthase [Pseudomonadota bacterium]
MTNPLPHGAVIGILGGGQLGRMLSVAASRLGYQCHIFDPAADAPAKQVAAFETTAGYDDLDALKAFASVVSVITYEFENIPTEALDAVEAITPIHPNRKALATSQDRLVEKSFLKSIGLKIADFIDVSDENDPDQVTAIQANGAILKTRRFGYDGKGQIRLTAQDDLVTAWARMDKTPAVLEAMIPFQSEISVIGARAQDGQVVCYDPGENEHRNGILHKTTLPANVPTSVRTDAVLATAKILNDLDYVGVIGVEFFVTSNGLLVNEFAPRVHNSGHWTQQGCAVDQFEQHIRAIAGLPLNDAKRHANVEMINLIGDDIDALDAYLSEGSSAIHLYGKAEARPGRKMGHVNRITGAA